MTRVELPWPDRRLSPNARVHWRERYRRSHAYRHACSWACVDSKVRKIEAHAVTATITFCPPDNRRRDQDNMLASIKSGLDAIAEAIGVDDSCWSLALRRGNPVKGGIVRVEIEAVAA